MAVVLPAVSRDPHSYDPGLCQHRKYALRTRGVENLGRRDDVGELADDVRRVRVLVEAGSGDGDQQPAHH